jgi:hypothetical protein
LEKLGRGFEVLKYGGSLEDESQLSLIINTAGRITKVIPVNL